MDNTLYWLWLLQVMGSFQLTTWSLLDHYGSPEAVYEAFQGASPPSSERFRGLTEAQRTAATHVPLDQSERLLRYCESRGIRVLSYDSDAYPERLRGIYNPPVVLFCKGDLSFLDEEAALTVVGTRKPSPYSLEVAKRICTDLAKVGVVLVSGFALGIDSVAHGAALSCSGRTVAVLGCGIEYDYPRENAKLKSIIAKRGAVISEFLPGAKPSPVNFPQRNRILSGLSLGTLVIEANYRSGSLITAELALQQGRDLFCIPPADIFDDRYAGVIRFLRDGAIPVFNHLDVLYEYYENFSHKLASANPYDVYVVKSERFEATKQPPVHRGRAPKEAPAVLHAPTEAGAVPQGDNELQNRILVLLAKRSLLADELAVLLSVGIDDILAELTELEIAGVVRAESGQRYAAAIPV